MEWFTKEFHELSVEDLYEIMKARAEVFVLEQGCSYQDLDDHDKISVHIYSKVNGEITSYARLLPKGSKHDFAAIGRVLVTKENRKNGYARLIMNQAMGYIINEWQEQIIQIQAQMYLIEFYGSIGFRKASDIYPGIGIPYIDMIYKVE